MKKTIFVVAACILLSGCFSEPDFLFESWDHEIVSANYVVENSAHYYRYYDDRFNENDWYDLWMDNSFYAGMSGWSPFDSVFISPDDFYYQPSYHEGYVEWRTFGEDILGAHLRFYRMAEK